MRCLKPTPCFWPSSSVCTWRGPVVDLQQLRWQPDNGAEFLEDADQCGLPGNVRACGSGHQYLPARAHTRQSDVRTVHRLVGEEFSDRETFGSVQGVWSGVSAYWWYFHLARPNRGKGWLSPLEILRARDPKLDLAIAVWRPLDLCGLLRQTTAPNGGHDLITYPCFRLARRRTVMQLFWPWHENRTLSSSRG